MARLYKRGKVWYSDIFVDGNRVRKPLDTDKGFALKKLSGLLELRGSGKYGRPSQDSSWEGFKAQFLNTISTKNRVTIQAYNRAIRNLEEVQPINSLSQITPAFLAKAKAAWTNRGLYVRNRDIEAIKAMMHLAESWKLVERQEWNSVKTDKEPKGRLLWYTAKELKRLISICKGVWKTIAYLGGRAGLRRSEIHWLSWEDVDFPRKRLHIAPKPEWTPKDHERRWIPMVDDLAEHLRGLTIDGKWVLGDDRPTVGSMTIYFKRLSRKAGLKGNIHTLRHTFGSHMASAGVSLFVLQEIMGHSKVEMTKRYAHLAPNVQQDAIKALPRL